MADSVVDNAVRDAKKLVELARDTVKNEMFDRMSPGVAKLVDRAVKQQLNATILSEGDTNMAGKDDLETESIASVFSGISEAECTDDSLDEGDIPTLDEMDSLEGDLDEEIEIDESELAKFTQESLKLEVQMSKGFKDLDLSGKEEVDQGNAIHDVKSGETHFGDIEPPAKKDWTVKEIKALIRRGLAENDQLRKENKRLKEDRRKLVEHLSKSNLFHTKVGAVNRIFSEGALTSKQKRAIIESVDSAKTVNEVKNIEKAITRTLGKSGRVNEGRGEKPRATGSRVRTPGVSNKVLTESVARGSSDSEQQIYNRWQELAEVIR